MSKLNDLIKGDNSVLTDLLASAGAVSIIGENYFDSHGSALATSTSQPMTLAGHLVSSQFFNFHRQDAERVLRLIAIWSEVILALSKNEKLSVSDDQLRKEVQALSVSIIEAAKYYPSINAKLVFVATYVGRGIEIAILRSQLSQVKVSDARPIELSVLLTTSDTLFDAKGGDITQELVDDIIDVIDAFKANNDISITVTGVTVQTQDTAVKAA